MYYYNIYIVKTMTYSNKNIFNIADEINWPYVVKKEARGIDNANFGEVQEIVLHYILTEKGIIQKEKFYLPTELVEGFDGDMLRFNISESDANDKFKRDSPPSAEEYAIYKKKEATGVKKEYQDDEKKNIAISLNRGISKSKEEDEGWQDNSNRKKLEQEQKNLEDPETLQNKKSSILKDDGQPRDSFNEKEIIEKARQEADNKARIDAERKAQSIIQQAEDKAKAEAEKRSKEIIQQAEDKIVLKQTNTKTIDYDPHQEKKIIEKNNYNDNNLLFIPFEAGLTIWQNYYLLYLNLTKEVSMNASKMTKDFENAIHENYTNKNLLFFK